MRGIFNAPDRFGCEVRLDGGVSGEWVCCMTFCFVWPVFSRGYEVGTVVMYEILNSITT